MLRTKTKRLIFASLLFLFSSIFLPIAMADMYIPSGNGIIPSDNGLIPINTETPTTTTQETTVPTETGTSGGADRTDTTVPTETGTSGGGLVSCGNEGGKACTFADLFTTFGNVINYVFQYIVPFLAVIGVVWAAITMMTSNGDPSKFAQGKSALISIAIGLIIIYLSWAIVKSFIQFLGGQSWTLQFFK